MWRKKRKWMRGLALVTILGVVPFGVQAAPGSPPSADTSQGAEAGVFSVAEDLADEAENQGAEYDGYIFKLKDDVALLMGVETAEGIEDVPYASKTYTADTLEQIEDFVDPSCIEYIEPNYMVYLDEIDSQPKSAENPNDTYFATKQWNMDMLNVPKVWSYGIEGEDMDSDVDMDSNGVADDDPIIVAVIDSGLLPNHEDIDYTHVMTGKNFVSSGSAAQSTTDTLGHGTFCTGLIMATKDNGKGIAGIGQDVYVMPLKVFETRSVASSVIDSAINYAAEQRELFNEDPTQGANISVINMSLGGSGGDSSQKAAVERAIDAGIIVVCAAGNDGDATSSYPAQYAIGIGALNSSGDVAYFSQRLSMANGTGYANKVWVSAPGESVTSLGIDSSSAYSTASGTSFSSPEVAALAALCKSIDNSIDHEFFKQLIKDTAVYKTSGLGTVAGQDVGYGWGLVDFAAAIESIGGKLTGESTVTIEIRNEAGTIVPNASYTIYERNDDDTRGAVIEPNSDGTYTLSRGQRYLYEASADKYETQSGRFTVVSERRTMTITLLGQPYTTRFLVRNTKGELLSNPVIEVHRANGALVQQNQDGSFSTRNGVYTYTVNADGYFETAGNFSIDDLTDDTLDAGKNIPITLYGDIDVCTLTFKVIGAQKEDLTGSTNLFLRKESGEDVPLYNGKYKLAPGVYEYTAENDTYRTVSGKLVVGEDEKGTTRRKDVYMVDKLNYVYIDVMPLTAMAQVTVTNGLGEIEEPLRAYTTPTYQLMNGTYRYKVESSGYNTYTGTFKVEGKKLYVDIQMEKGSKTIDDGTSAEQFLTVNTSYYSVANFKKYASESEYNLGGRALPLTGITLADLIEHFTANVQTATSVDVLLEDETVVTLQPEQFKDVMIAWTLNGHTGLYLAEDGAAASLNNPKIVTVNYHEHSETEVVVKEPTCTEPGLSRFLCRECGEEREEVLPALGHDYDPMTGVCSRCGESVIFDDDTTITVNGMEITSADMRKYTTVATYSMVGYSGESDHYVVGILFSDLVKLLPDVCVSRLTFESTDGYTMSWNRSDFESTMIAWYIDGETPGSYDTDNGLRVAQDGGASGVWMYSPSVGTASGTAHTYGEVAVVPPSCGTGGYSYEICTVCGDRHEFDYTDPTGAHDWVENTGAYKEPTCTEPGERVFYCTICGENKTEPVEPLGHDYDENGICRRCGERAEEGALHVINKVEGAVITEPEGGWHAGSNRFSVTVPETEQKPVRVIVCGKEGDATLLEPSDDGQYTLAVDGEEQTLYVLFAGDVNLDGNVDIADLVQLRAEASGQVPIKDAVARLAADVNGDGAITLSDIVETAQLMSA